MSWYTIVSDKGQLVVDIDGEVKEGAFLKATKENGSDSQRWRFESEKIYSKLGLWFIGIEFPTSRPNMSPRLVLRSIEYQREWALEGKQIVYKVPNDTKNGWVMDVEGNTGIAGSNLIACAENGGPNQAWTLREDPESWDIVYVGWETVLGVPKGVVESRRISTGLETESKEEEKDLNWTFTDNQWGVAAEATVTAEWGWGSAEGTVSGYTNQQTQTMVKKVKTHFKRDYRKIYTETEAQYTGPVYIHQAVMSLKSSKGNVRNIRSQYYIISTETPNASYEKFIDVSKF